MQYWDTLFDVRRESVISRRQFLQRSAMFGLAGVAATSLVSCAGPPLGGQQTLTYWNLFGGGDGVRMLQMQRAFERDNPSINLNAVTLAWGAPYYTKLAMASVGESPPDVAIMHMSRMPPYAQGGLLDSFDLNQLAQHGINQTDFLPAIWERGFRDGKLYAIPLDTHPFVMYYNTDVCQKAGLLESDGSLKPIQGPTELIDAFARAKRVTGNLGLAVDTQDVTPWRIFSSLYGQLGGKVLSPDGKTYVMDEAKAEQALSFMADLTLKSKVASPTIDYAGAIALFASGKAGFFWQGEWEITTFQAVPKFHFNMVPFPNVFGNNTVQADSHSFVLPHNSGDHSAALALISSMLKNGITWAQGGHIPAYLPIATSQAYKQLKPQSNYAAVAANVAIDPPAWFSGSGSELENQAGAAFQSVMDGQQTSARALKEFKTAIQRLLNTPPPV